MAPLALIIFAVLVVAVVGACIGLLTAYTITLHNQVDQLQAQVCHYQQQAIKIADALAAAGRPVVLPPPAPCP